MKNSIHLRKICASVLVALMLINITGCSDYLKKIALEKVTDYITTSLNGFFENPETVLSENSQAEIVYPELIEQQTELAHTVIHDSAYEISKIKLNEKRTEAVVTLTFEKCPSFATDDPIGTVDELEDQLEYDEKDIDVTVIRTKDHKWIFEDLNELVEIFYAPFELPCVLDDNGDPYNINAAYMNMIYVDDYWFDPLMNNPLQSPNLRQTDYLKCVFYFNRPMSITCTAELQCNGNVVDTVEVDLNGSVTADCHFTNTAGNFSAGSYTVVLYFNEQEMATSGAITVS